MAWYYWTVGDTTSSGTSGTWERWTSTSTTYIAKSTSNQIWGTWTNGTLNVDPTSDTTTWSNWVFYGDGTVQPGQINGEQVRQSTEEERQRHETERIRMAELAKEKESQRKIAEEKALQLLLENLTENQAEIFKMTGAIPIESPSGRKYKINKGTSQNIEEIDEKGTRKARLCFHPCDYAIPVHDVMLAQKLMLEVCEEDARKIANFS